MKKQTITSLKKIGLLDDVEMHREQKIVDAFNAAIEWFKIHIENRADAFSALIIPLIIRITHQIDINNIEVEEILEEAQIAYKIYDATEPEHYNAIDREAEFVGEFADKIIEKYKKQ